MSQEFTFYTLFVMLTLSVGIIFQFCLARIKALGESNKKLLKSLSHMHRDLYFLKNKEEKQYTKFTQRSPSRNSRPKVLRGDLTLEYNGSKADTRATFMLDKE